MLLGVRTITVFKAIKGFKWRDLISADTIKRWFHALDRGREPESLQTLQLITLQRAICTSDDPATLLYATANIIGISNPSQIVLLWNDPAFQERFIKQFKNSHARTSQLRGRDPNDTAVAERRLYCGVAAYIMTVLDSNRIPSYDLTEVPKAKEAMISTPYCGVEDGHSECSAALVRATLRFPVPQLYGSSLLDEANKDIANRMITYSDSNSDPDTDLDRGLLSVIVWTVFNLHTVQGLKMESLPQPHGRHDVESMIQILDKAFKVLTGPEGGDLVDGEVVLMNMLRGIRRIVVRAQSSFTLHHKFALLEICEPILKSPRVSDAMRQVIRNMRLDLAQAWQQRCTHRAVNEHLTGRLVTMLEEYLDGLRPVYRADSGCNEYLEVLQAFGPGIRKLFSYDPKLWSFTGMRARIAFHKSFNAFVYDVDRLSRKIQNNTLELQVRDPDERWCHWEEPLSITAVYSQSDPPDSQWAGMQQSLEKHPIPPEHSQSF